MPGDPAYGVFEPARPIQLEAVCGPRKPGPSAKQSSSSAKATEEPKEQTGPANQQKYKAPTPYDRACLPPT
eukprot:6255290-Amphidinium_carterae.1